MAGTLASPMGKGIQKASEQGGIHVHQSLLPDLKDHPLGNLFLQAEADHPKSHAEIRAPRCTSRYARYAGQPGQPQDKTTTRPVRRPRRATDEDLTECTTYS